MCSLHITSARAVSALSSHYTRAHAQAAAVTDKAFHLQSHLQERNRNDDSAAPRQQQPLKLHVGRLTRNVTEAHVREIFSTYGELASVHLAIDERVQLPKGYAVVEFASTEEGEAAKDYMDGGQIDGNTIT